MQGTLLCKCAEGQDAHVLEGVFYAVDIYFMLNLQLHIEITGAKYISSDKSSVCLIFVFF